MQVGGAGGTSVNAAAGHPPGQLAGQLQPGRSPAKTDLTSPMRML